MKPSHVIPLLLALCACPLLHAASAATKPVAFRANVRVDVDASGKPVKVQAPADLPDAIRTYVEKQVATWQYEPAKQGGVAVPAMTYVQVAACAIPNAAGDAYTLAADFDGNGPRYANDQPLPPPAYPKMALRRGEEAKFRLVLAFDGDGKTRIETIEKVEVDRKVHSSEFELELRRWVGRLHFDTELVAGQPVAGRVRVPVSFAIDEHRDLSARRDEVMAGISASRECQMARGDGAIRPVALESVVKVTPVPAG